MLQQDKGDIDQLHLFGILQQLKRMPDSVANKGGRQITAISINPTNKYVAMTDDSNDHILYVFEISSGRALKIEKSSPDRIYHIQWSKKSGENIIATAGVKHFSLWDLDNPRFKKRKGIYLGKGEANSHC